MREPLTKELIGRLGDDAIERISEIWAIWDGPAGDVRLLKHFVRAKSLNITDRGATANLAVLNDLTHIESLAINTDGFVPDFSRLSCLRELSILYHRAHFKHAEMASNLQTLLVFRWGARDLTEFTRFPRLRALEIAGGRLHSVTGVSRMPLLRSLRLYKLPSLVDVTELSEARALESLEIDTCRKIENITFVQGLVNLRSLLLNDIGAIPSLWPVSRLKNLKELNFTGSTNVIDGDTAIVKRMKLDTFSFMNRKHYNFVYDHVTGQYEE